jgi:ATP-dependent Lon protease
MDAGKHILLSRRNPRRRTSLRRRSVHDRQRGDSLQMLKLPDGTVKVLVEGTQRAHVVRVIDEGEYCRPKRPRSPARPVHARVEAMRAALSRSSIST